MRNYLNISNLNKSFYISKHSLLIFSLVRFVGLIIDIHFNTNDNCNKFQIIFKIDKIKATIKPISLLKIRMIKNAIIVTRLNSIGYIK